MIQAHEIKVGNRFIRELRNSKGLEYDHDFILTEEWMGKLFGDNTSIALQDLFPIPLSKEVLLAYGFTPNKLGALAIELEDIATHLELSETSGCYYPYIDQMQEMGSPQNLALPFIQYLHELQHLYWCLCKTDLKYQP